MLFWISLLFSCCDYPCCSGRVTPNILGNESRKAPKKQGKPQKAKSKEIQKSKERVSRYTPQTVPIAQMYLGRLRHTVGHIGGSRSMLPSAGDRAIAGVLQLYCRKSQLDWQNRQSPMIGQSLAFSERGQPFQAIPFHVERMLHACTPVARFESQLHECKLSKDQCRCFVERYDRQRTTTLSFLPFFVGKGKVNPQKTGFFIPTEPLKSLDKKGKTLNEKLGNPRKGFLLENQGF